MTRVIFFNGPPRVGKDEAARALYDYGAYHEKLSEPLKTGLRKMFSLTESEISQFEDNKDEPSPIFNGLSWRKAQVRLSEDFFKPTFGKEILGHLCLRRIHRVMPRLVAISDSGFVEETLPIVREFGAKNCLLIRLSAKGRSFVGDSRSYIQLPIKTFNITNDDSLADFRRRIIKIGEDFARGNYD